MKCILNVTDHEYDKILQWTHDAVQWKTSDMYVLNRIAELLGANVADEIERYDDCRMEKHDGVSGLRVEPDLVEVAWSAPE